MIAAFVILAGLGLLFCVVWDDLCGLTDRALADEVGAGADADVGLTATLTSSSVVGADYSHDGLVDEAGATV